MLTIMFTSFGIEGCGAETRLPNTIWTRTQAGSLLHELSGAAGILIPSSEDLLCHA